jgi:hypothetical protein
VSTFPRRRILATIEELFFSVRSMPRGYRKDKEDRLSQSCSRGPSEQVVESWEDGVESLGDEY